MKFKGCGKIWTKKSDAHSGQDIKKTVGPKFQIGLMIILPVIPSNGSIKQILCQVFDS